MKRRHFVAHIKDVCLYIQLPLWVSACGMDEEPTNRRRTLKKKTVRPPSPSTQDQDAEARKDRDTQPVKPETTEVIDQPVELPPENNEQQPSVTRYTFFPLFAVATYFDGTDGPTTAEITPEVISSKEDTPFTFWHGHNGQDHQFELKVEDKIKILKGERVEITTTEVGSHRHVLYIDPTQTSTRIPSQSSVEIEVEDEA